jgi:protein-S-isoprenylcysteine O-methyltransferase Ste14
VRGVLARGAQIAVVLIVEGALVFGAAGKVDWVWAWAYLALYVASIVVNATLLLRNSAEVAAERGRPGEIPRWDKIVSGLWALAQFVAIPLVAGLDERFGWTGGLGLVWHLAGGLLFAAGLALFGWAMISNAWFSTASRVQPERAQAVCRRGPYRAVRHPGYVGSMLQSVGIPLLLGSLWALLPAIAAVVLMALRTSLEDRMLRDGLPGYADYTTEVRYRLVPGVW